MDYILLCIYKPVALLGTVSGLPESDKNNPLQYTWVGLLDNVSWLSHDFRTYNGIAGCGVQSGSKVAVHLLPTSHLEGDTIRQTSLHVSLIHLYMCQWLLTLLVLHYTY